MKLLIIGAGAAGLIAGITAAKNGNSVTILEKNEKVGKKLYITGKGRCNITNDCDENTFYKSVKRNPRFLFSSFSGFTSQDTMDFFEKLGLQIKVERGNRVFPESDKSSDVIRALEQECRRLGIEIRLNTVVKDMLTEDGSFRGLMLSDKSVLYGDSCIIATGGLSYPTTGSTGDGYEFAKKLGHTVLPCSPSLVSLTLKENVKELEGLSLKNVTLSVTAPVEKKGKLTEKQIYHDFGEMLFTDKGISGPLVLSASAELAPVGCKEAKCFIDLKPALSAEQLDARVLHDFTENINKQFRNALSDLLPARMADYIVKVSGIDPYAPVNSITAEQRSVFVSLLKHLPFEIKGTGGYNEAVITCGGVNVKEINPSTMESKLVQGVYFAGEVLDLDAVTGGFNLQIAWSTGVCAGRGVSDVQ